MPGLILLALITNSLYQKVELGRRVASGKVNQWYVDLLETVGFTATGAFEMNMLVVMIVSGTRNGAQCIL
jgi:hypothetical protein